MPTVGIQENQRSQLLVRMCSSEWKLRLTCPFDKILFSSAEDFFKLGEDTSHRFTDISHTSF